MVPCRRPDAPAYPSYTIWRGATPYFTPTGTPLATVVPPSNHYDDVGVLGPPASSHYYLVEGRPAAGGSLPSQRTGVFEFPLTPGQ